MEQSNWWLVSGAVCAGLAVALGAFGAHGLEGRVTADRLATFETAVRYQMYHGLALLILAFLQTTIEHELLRYVGILWIAGIIIFSGSLYFLVLTDTPVLGAITPIGGVLMIGGWGLLAVIGLQQG